MNQIPNEAIMTFALALTSLSATARLDAHSMRNEAKRNRICLLVLLLTFCQAASAHSAPIALHPKNPHYFLFRGKPTVLITSGEHYGAVLNLDFNYFEYLATLKAGGLNLT